jgi:hypothetical protein
MAQPNHPTPPPQNLRVRAQAEFGGSAELIYTPFLVSILHLSTGVPSAYSIVETGPDGKIDPSFLPPIPSGLTLLTNGVLNVDQTRLNLVAGPNMVITNDAFGNTTIAGSGTISTSFQYITSGTNTGQTLTVGTGSVLSYSGTGVINANQITGVTVTNTPTGANETLVSTSPTTAQWQTGGTGGGNFVQATIDFGYSSGGQGDTAQVTVPATWVTSTSIILVGLAALSTPDHDPDDAVLEQIVVGATNLVPGVSFDIFAYAPNGTWGRYLVNATGQ